LSGCTQGQGKFPTWKWIDENAKLWLFFYKTAKNSFLVFVPRDSSLEQTISISRKDLLPSASKLKSKFLLWFEATDFGCLFPCKIPNHVQFHPVRFSPEIFDFSKTFRTDWGRAKFGGEGVMGPIQYSHLTYSLSSFFINRYKTLFDVLNLKNIKFRNVGGGAATQQILIIRNQF
jgi:hypothetical protein